jgi:hypothetical protein
MAREKVSVLAREAIASAAKGFPWNRKMPKWTVIVEGRELPARPLVLQATGVPPQRSYEFAPGNRHFERERIGCSLRRKNDTERSYPASFAASYG